MGGGKRVETFHVPIGFFYIHRPANNKMGELNEAFPHFGKTKCVENSRERWFTPSWIQFYSLLLAARPGRFDIDHGYRLRARELRPICRGADQRELVLSRDN